METAASLHPDEMCVQVKEVVEYSIDDFMEHRVQRVRVMRGGKLYEHVTDLGPAVLYSIGEFQILGSRDFRDPDTVGHMLEWANKQRGSRPFHVKYGVGMPDIRQRYMEYSEAEYKAALGQSVYGPGISVQRS